ncbi:amino acid permease [Knoellia sinensis KCTC 19936]|uniref:Amino acid permease n=1 Tax=Knoellia sinensis KCTC 19936 TaxID=1385520 RepID=A0A0A0J0I3_9MICO|nr:amino acid permease [Knoellia sinensis]KGN30920.1 amino acid permease [Knoellia sinensis KCTC 19936]
MSIWRTKSIEQTIAEGDEPDYQLKKRLTALDLTVFGVGVVIGAGIFTVAGRAANQLAGPAVILSFIIAAFCCALAALCYAEFASAIPVSGSAYTFSYATLGELVAWIIGWDLLLELLLGASVVAQGWSAYLGIFLDHLGITIPESVAYGSSFDLPAFILVLILTALVSVGIKESMRVNMALVALKVFIVLFVIFAGIGFIKSENYSPFIPPSQPTESGSTMEQPLLDYLFGFAPAAFGISGIFAAASLVFFAYIGFDVVATTAEEAKNPARDLPRGIIGSLIICTILYCGTALVLTGMVPYHELAEAGSLAGAFEQVGKPAYATLISAGAVAGLTTVVMTLLIGASRVVFAMSRDWLLPSALGRVNPKTGTPLKITIGLGLLVALVAALTPVGKLEFMINIGTLTAFFLVSIAVPVLRKRRPDFHRPFKVPFSPWLPWLSAAICAYLMLTLPVETWIRFGIWLALGFLIYFVYGYRKSRIAVGAEEEAVFTKTP